VHELDCSRRFVEGHRTFEGRRASPCFSKRAAADALQPAENERRA
jgi:hypothetical protein